MTIDPEKLEEAAEHLSKQAQTEHDWIHVRRSQVVIAVEAARITLNSLPRYKEVEVESWATFFHDGRICSSGLTEKEARGAAARSPLEQVAVRLTGTAKVTVTP